MSFIAKDPQGQLRSIGVVPGGPSGSSDSSGITKLSGVLTEEQILTVLNYNDGIYTLESVEYGHEILFINRQNLMFKRITGLYDYIYDTVLTEWVISSGGGSGGGRVSAALTTDTSYTVALGSIIDVGIRFKSGETDKGSAYVYVNGALKVTKPLNKGDNSFNIGTYVKAGENTIVIKCADNAGNTTTLPEIIVTAIDLTFTSVFDDNNYYYGESFRYDYRVSGGGSTEVTFELDNTVVGTQTINANGSTQVFNVPISNVAVGVHPFTVAASVTVGEKTISTIRVYNLIIIAENSTEIIVKSEIDRNSVTEGEPVNIKYTVYDLKDITLPDPTFNPVNVERYVNDELVAIVSGVSGTAKPWHYVCYSENIIGGGTTLKFKVVTSDGRTKEVEYGVAVDELDISVDIAPNAVIALDSKNRNNESADKELWQSGNVSVTLSNFTWGVTNGWLADENNISFLRLNGSARAIIPYKLFTNDLISTGAAIEFTFRTSNISNALTSVISCFNNNIGLNVYPNSCELITSSSRKVSTKYKEDEKITIAFVIEQSGTAEVNCIKTYVNGVLSGLTPYVTGADKLKQNTPVNITLGSSDCTLDIYSIRIYNTELTDSQVVQNYMTELSPSDLLYKYPRNNIIKNQQIDYDSVKHLIPTMVIIGKMPTSKIETDNLPLVDVSFYNPHTGFSFDYTQVPCNVQGTSSQDYPRKNYKLKFPEKFSFYEGAVPEKTYTLKADYMESSHAHNTGNAILIDKFSPKFTGQADNVRNAIYGFPMLLFVQEGDELVCYGVYNFNNDKGNADTLGLTTDKSESWEFKNSDSKRCNFQTACFEGVDETGEPLPNWTDDFEARHHHTDEKDYTQLQKLMQWVYNTKDDLTKFKSEFESHLNLDFCLYYYIMMDIMLAMDSRAKNMFLDTFDGEIWYPRWYDIDTTYGLNNVGRNIFGYGLEQGDKIDELDVYNGSNSVLWNNFGTAFAEEIKEYYHSLREKVSYESMIAILEGEQISQISEVMYNEDAKFKYVLPLLPPTSEDYAYAAQGSRLDHLRWWLSNRFKYLDSKYNYTTYSGDFIRMRVTAADSSFNSTYTITPDIDMYVGVMEGSNKAYVRATANTPCTITPKTGPTDTNEQEARIYGAKNLLNLGDLSKKYVAEITLSNSSRLKVLTLGSTTSGYTNPYLRSIDVRENTALEELNIANCSGLIDHINLSGALGLRKLYAQGTSITGVSLPESGNLTTLNLPTTVTSLIVTNQIHLSSFSFSGKALTTLKIINTTYITNTYTLVSNSINTLTEVELDNINWTVANNKQDILNKLVVIGAKLKGKIHVSGRVGDVSLTRWQEAFPNITVTADETGIAYSVNFYNTDETLLQTSTVFEGENAVYTGETPINPDNDANKKFIGWSEVLSNIISNLDIYAVYSTYDDTIYHITSSANSSVIVTPYNFTGNINIDWGDSTFDTLSSGQRTHTYSTAGEYIITIKFYPDLTIDEEDYRYISLGGSGYTITYAYLSNFFTALISTLLDYNSGTGAEVIVPSTITNISMLNDYSTIGSDAVMGCIKYNGTLTSWLRIPRSNRPYRNTLDSHHLYCLENSEYTLIKGDLVIPKGIASLNHTTFAYNQDITSITLNSPIRITEDTFSNCTYLTSVHNSTYITELGNSAFNSSGITSFTVCCSVPNYCFQYCANLVSVQLDVGATAIGTDAFYGCTSLTEVSLSTSVTSIGSLAFLRCSALTEIHIPSTVVSMGNRVFEECSALTDVVFLANISILPEYTFSDCTNLTSITLSDTIEYIEAHAFESCTNLSEVRLPMNLKQIKRYAFNDCHNINKVYYNNTLLNWLTVEMGEYVILSDRSKTYYAAGLYSNELYLKDSLNNYKLMEHVIIPDGITEIKARAFGGHKSIKTVDLPISVISIGIAAFYSTSLYSISLNEGLTTINSSAFNSCPSLTDLVIPSTVITLGEYIISNNSNLRTITLEGTTPPSITSNTFANNNLTTIYVPKGCGDAYKTTTNWSTYADIIQEVE